MAADEKFKSVNAFRGELSDRWAMTMPREVAEATFNELRKQIQTNTARIDTMSGKSMGTSATVGLGLAVATILISLIVLFANH